MLRHTGERRSFAHNMRLAVLLCLNAGFINAAGFLAFTVLTTNVTGHAALLAVHTSSGDLRSARMAATWVLLFFAGALVSSLYIHLTGRDKRYAYTIPIIVIIGLVLIVAITGQHYHHLLSETEYFAGILLFAMGIQNALVSIISGSVVRTTHLTGMVTDLGIDLSTAISKPEARGKRLSRKIILRLTIVLFFLFGGMGGAAAFSVYGFRSFFIPVGLLLLTLFYDFFRISIVRGLRIGL